MQERKGACPHGKASKSRDRVINLQRTDKAELIKYYFCGFGKIFIVSMLFYKSIIICFCISAIYGWLNIKGEIKRNIEQWKWNVNLEFKEMMLSVSAALSAGYSIENSIRESKKDIELLYGKQSLLLPEIEKMLLSVENSLPIEKAISEFASECDVEDIKCFSDIFCIAQRTGGNMVEIVKSTADKISSKIEVNREIKTMIAAKKMESRIMNVVPLLIIVYFWLTSPGFLDCLYTMGGHIFMTILFLIYMIGCMFSNKIADIKI